MVYTGQNPCYPGLVKKNYRHEALNHGVGEYIKGTSAYKRRGVFLGYDQTWTHGCLSQDEQKASCKDTLTSNRKAQYQAAMEQMDVIFKGMYGERLACLELIQTGN